MAKKNLSERVKNSSYGFHRDGTTGSWGTDPDDGKIIGDILRGIGDLIKSILVAKH